MPSDHNSQQGRRPHFHRGRRGMDRRGGERRAPQQAPEQGGGRDQVDVEQIMLEIRARISQRHGIELSTQQIQELAARRLEAILDPSTLKPSLLEQLKRSAGTDEAPAGESPATYEFEDTTLYETHRGVLRFIRRLLNPILKLFFNPTPLIQALNTQTRINADAAERGAWRDRRQVEWNALHYEIVQRLVTEVARTSIEMQSLALRVESLAGKVDFNERRVRGLESSAGPPKPAARVPEMPAPAPAVAHTAERPATEQPATEQTSSEGVRRKRRRRRGRRSGMGAMDQGTPGPRIPGAVDADAANGGDEGDLEEGEDEGAPSGPSEQALATPTPAPEYDPAPPAPEISVPAPPTEDPVRPASVHESPAPPAIEQTVTSAPPQPAAPPVQPAPPPDEPSPASPVDHPDPGPPDR